MLQYPVSEALSAPGVGSTVIGESFVDIIINPGAGSGTHITESAP